MKLWEAEIEEIKVAKIVVYANTQEEAEAIADDRKYEILNDIESEATVLSVNHISPNAGVAGWKNHDLVYTDDSMELTLGEARELAETAAREAAAEEEFKRRQIDMFPNERGTVQ